MIIRKDLLKLVPATDKVLNSAPAPYVFTGEEEYLSNVLFERMVELGGVGLSANQLGLNFTVFVMGLDNIRYTIFNPKILSYSKETTNFSEGCLSFPGISLDISRSVSIEVEYQNTKGEIVQETLHGLTARIFQHEYDHMFGKTFKAHVSPMKWAMAVKKFKNKKDKIVKKYTNKILVNIAKNSQSKAEVQ